MSLSNVIFNRRGVGWIPNPPDNRDRPVDLMGLSSDALLSKVSLRKHVMNVFDQKSTNSCVAQSLAGAIGILETRVNWRYMPPSRLFLYYNARAFHGGQKSDSGTYLRTAVKGLCKFGVPDEKWWEFSSIPFKVNRRPGWNPYMMAFSRSGGEYFWVLDTGSARVLAIKAALNAGYPVSFGTMVDSLFPKSDGLEPIDPPGNFSDVIGGHAMIIIGYEESSDGLKFEILNSWGDDWGDNGYAWFTEDYIRWPMSRDFVIVRGWNRLREGEM